MAGIESLMQGPVPGQAPQQPMPGMMPQQGAATPAAMVGPLSQMHMQQLVQLMLNPRPDGPPLYAVISAISEQQKKAQAQEAVQRQLAMGQGQQAAQQPPIAQQLVAKAMQPTQMAAHGGIMRGYAGGGAVAFQTAGAIPPGLLNPDVDEDGLPRGKDEREQIIDYNERLKSAYQQSAKAQATQAQAAAATAPRPSYPEEAKRRLEQFYRFGPRGSGGVDAKNSSSTPASSVPMSMQDTRGGTPEMAALAQMLGSGSSAAAPGPSASPGGQRQAAAPAPAPAPVTGLPALSAERRAEITADQAKAEKLAADQAAVVERLSKTSPEVLAARENLQRIMGKAYDPQKKTLEEAKDLFARGIGSNAEALGRMAAAMGGAKRFGQGLAAAAGAGAQFVGEQRKRVESLQDEYNKLQSQLEMTMAQAQYADVIGDDKLKREALTKAEEIKKNLFDTQRSIRKESFGEQVQQAQGIAALRDAASRETQARAAMISAGKPSEVQQREALYRRDPKAYEAMYGAKESAAVANLVRAVNSDPRLKKLAESILPDAEAQYNARYKELVATYAPELLLGAGGGGGGGGGGVLEAATAIARGGKQ